MQENPGKSEDKVKTVRLLIEHGADVKAQDENHSTPLHMASSSEIPGLVWHFIEHKADAIERDWRHRTPLHLVSSWVNAESFYLRFDVLMNGQNDSSHRTFQEASHGKADTVGLLIYLGVDVTVQDETQSTALHLASSVGSAETVQLLIKHGADVNAHDRSHRTPLHLASSRVSTENVLHGIG